MGHSYSSPLSTFLHSLEVLKALNVSEFVSVVFCRTWSRSDVQFFDLSRPCGIRSVNPSRTNKPVKIRKKLPNEGRGIREGPPLRVYANAVPLDGDHTTALIGTLRRHTLRLMLARADSVKVVHSSDYITDAVDLDLKNSKAMESA